MKEINIKDWTRKNDPNFVRKIVDEHYLLLSSIAGKYAYKNSNFTRDELIAEGSIGLIRAISSFEPTKNIKFSTYAYFWIKNKILSYINSTNNIKAASYDKHSRIVYDLDLADIHIENSSHNPSSTNLENSIVDESYINAFNIFLFGLRETDRQVLIERLRGEITLKELSEKIGISRETVRQIEIKQIKNFKFFLKEVMKFQDIPGFVRISILLFFL